MIYFSQLKICTQFLHVQQSIKLTLLELNAGEPTVSPVQQIYLAFMRSLRKYHALFVIAGINLSAISRMVSFQIYCFNKDLICCFLLSSATMNCPFLDSLSLVTVLIFISNRRQCRHHRKCMQLRSNQHKLNVLYFI